MKLSEFVDNLPDRIWCFKDDELSWYEISWDGENVAFFNSGNDVMDQWCCWGDFLADCEKFYLSVEDFEAGKSVTLELD